MRGRILPQTKFPNVNDSMYVQRHRLLKGRGGGAPLLHYVQQPHYATGLMFLMVIGRKHNQSFGGLDLRSLAEHSCAVFISSMTSSGQCSPDDRHMMQTVTSYWSLGVDTLYNSLQWHAKAGTEVINDSDHEGLNIPV